MRTHHKTNLLQRIGLQLRKLKIENNKTSKELASVLNITPQAYGNIERGESDICITRLILLAEFYQKPLLDLIPHEYRNFENGHEFGFHSKGKTMLVVK